MTNQVHRSADQSDPQDGMTSKQGIGSPSEEMGAVFFSFDVRGGKRERGKGGRGGGDDDDVLRSYSRWVLGVPSLRQSIRPAA